jgi:uncharacterized protein
MVDAFDGRSHDGAGPGGGQPGGGGNRWGGRTPCLAGPTPTRYRGLPLEPAAPPLSHWDPTTSDMSEIARLSSLLEESGDPRNPGALELRELLVTTRSVAVVGLSRDTRKPARRVPSYLATKGLDIIPVNPFADRLLGRKAHPRLSSVTEPVDMVLVFRPSEDAGEVLLDTLSRPERPAVWLPEGVLAPEAAKVARSRGITVVQDLCIYLAFRELEDFVPRPAAPLREALPPPPHDPWA